MGIEANRRYYEKMRLDPEYRKRRAEHSRQSRLRHLEEAKKRELAYGAKRRLDPAYVERERQRGRDRAAAHPEENKARLRDSLYGKGAHDYFKETIVEQNNKCAVCGEVLDMSYNTHLDHDHATGQWRSVLCGGCNAGLGNFRENPDYLLRAIAYLSKWKASPCTQ